MRSVRKDVNEFFSSTSIHGLSYISDNQSRSTRIIWTLILVGAFGVTSYFLYNTIDGFSDKYVTTTLETRSVKGYPFPAITFHPGEYNSKDEFLRHFLNQFEFTRYEENSPLRDNGKFMNLYEWLISPTNDELFDDIEKILINDKEVFTGGPNKGKTNLQYLARTLEDEVCNLVALQTKNISLKASIRDIFVSNLYKIKWHAAIVFTKNQVGPIIHELSKKQNLSQSEIAAACRDANKQNIKTKMEALLVSFHYLFKSFYVDVGAGDLATGPYRPHLTRDTHTLVTNMYNNMVNGSLPGSVLEFPLFFVLPNKFSWRRDKIAFTDLNQFIHDDLFIYGEDRNIIEINNLVNHLNFTAEAMRNYHYLWYSYINKRNFTLFCVNSNYEHYPVNCSTEALKFFYADEDWHYDMIEIIRGNSTMGTFIEGEPSTPPCTSVEIIKQFKIAPICNFIANISMNKEAFLRLMKFTKQSPVFMEYQDKYSSISTKNGYILKNISKVRYGPMDETRLCSPFWLLYLQIYFNCYN